MLPTFDLPALIEKYNAENSTHFSLKETFNFDYFEPRFLKNIKGTVAFIFHGTDSQYFTQEEKAYQQGPRENYQEALRQYASQEITEKPSKPEWEEAVHNKIIYREWVLAKQAELNQDEKWKKWSTLASNANLATLRAIWECQSIFAHHTHAALIEAMGLLNELISHYQAARLALTSYWNRRRIPAAILTAYQDHITAFFEAAQQVQQAMVESMVGRLHAWEQGEESVVVHTVKKVLTCFEAAGATLKKDNALPFVPEALTREQFATFHQTIERHGNEHTKKRLQRLPWRAASKQRSLHLNTVQQEEITVVVPEVLVSDIPQKKPLRIFKGAILRYRYFHGKEQLMALLAKPHATNEIRVDVNDRAGLEKNLRAIRAKEVLLNTALNEVTVEIIQLSSLWHRRSIRYLKTWQGLLENQRIQQLLQKLSLIEKLLADMQRQDRFALIQAGVVCEYLNQLLIEVQQNIDFYQLVQSGISAQLERTKLKAAAYLPGHRAYQALSVCAEETVLPHSELFFVIEYVEGLCAAENLAAFSKIAEPQLARIARFLKNHLQHDNFLDATINHDLVQQGDCLIEKLGSSSQKRHWHHQRIKYFHRYLAAKKHALIQPEQDSKIQLSLHKAEQLLLQIGQNVSYFNKHTSIADIVRQISNQRSDQQKVGLISHYQSLSVHILNELLVGRFNKDVTVFHDKIVKFLEGSESFSSSDIDRILGICDKAIEDNKSLEDITDDSYDRTLLGLNNPNNKILKPILDAYILTERAHRVVSKKASITQNQEQLQQVKKYLSNPAYKKSFSDILKSRSGKRMLFIQDNIDTDIFEEEGDSLTSNSNLLRKTL